VNFKVYEDKYTVCIVIILYMLPVVMKFGTQEGCDFWHIFCLKSRFSVIRNVTGNFVSTSCPMGNNEASVR